MTKARKFYLMTDDITKNPAGLIFENERKLTPLGQRVFGLVDISHRGLPVFEEPPRFQYQKREGRKPLDVERYAGFWLISDRAKAVFEMVDPEAFQFSPCEMKMEGVSTFGDYWLCDVIRVLDAIDEENSDITVDETSPRKIYKTAGSKSWIFKDDVVGKAHIFRMDFTWLNVICDDLMKKACNKAGLKSVMFTDAIQK